MREDRLNRCSEGGNSLLVGTVSADGTPACCRAVALTTSDDFGTATVYVPVDTAQETIANIATTRRIAIGCSDVITHTTVQFKGTTRAVRLAREDEADFLRSRMEAFAGTLERIGMPRRLAMRIAHWPAFAIEVAIAEVFDQTPGPNAGNPLR